ncbi:MAG: hypothetical protein GYA21_04120 [Myxococcales bacterium]|nr:hypothetical protein [Myxococcales bacterium]
MGRKLLWVAGLLVVAGITALVLERLAGPSTEAPAPPASAPAAAPEYPPEFQPPAPAADAGPSSEIAPPEPPPEAPVPEPPLQPLAPRTPSKGSRPVGASSEAELVPVYAVRDTTPPPLMVLSPADRSYFLDTEVKFRVRSEAGAVVRVNGAALAEAGAELFEGAVRLAFGEREVIVEAEDGVGNRREVKLRLTCVDPSRIRGVRERFAALLSQLDELRALALELDRRAEDLLARQRDTPAESISALEGELRTIRSERRELQREIEADLAAIDQLLRRPAP